MIGQVCISVLGPFSENPGLQKWWGAVSPGCDSEGPAWGTLPSSGRCRKCISSRSPSLPVWSLEQGIQSQKTCLTGHISSLRSSEATGYSQLWFPHPRPLRCSPYQPRLGCCSSPSVHPPPQAMIYINVQSADQHTCSCPFHKTPGVLRAGGRDLTFT